MATTTVLNIKKADGWTKAVDTADTAFCIQNIGNSRVSVFAGAAAPAAGVDGFQLRAVEGFTRAHFASGDVYVRAEDDACLLAVFK